MIRKRSNKFKFKPFSEKQLKILNWWQEGSPTSDRFFVVADGSIRAGKSNVCSSKLYTPNGYKIMGDIQIGDYVFDRRGKPTRVLGVYPQGKLDAYKITFHDGSKTICSKDHLWTFSTQKCVTNGNKTMFTLTLGEIMKELEKFSDRKTIHERAGKFRFPINGCVEFESIETKIDPYLLGLLLGDGCFTEKVNRVTFTNDEIYLHDYMDSIAGKYGLIYKFSPHNGEHCARGSFIIDKKNQLSQTNLIKNYLLYYNLYGCYSHNKFIPNDYKYNSKDVRLNILAGLLNTDGSVNNNRPSISFCSTSRQLVDDVAEVARSLGMFVNTDKAVDTREKNKHDCFECCIRVNDELYPLLSSKHKSRLKMDTTKTKEWKMIKSIEYVGKEECQCIMVDNEEHLYLTDDFIVTHNTISMALSFLLFVMHNFNQLDAAMAGKTIGALRRNLVNPLKQIGETLGYEITDHRSDNYLEVSKGNITNNIWLFGAKDEASQDLVDCAVCG